jgi:hypothetical protein
MMNIAARFSLSKKPRFIDLRTPQVLSCEQQITTLSKVCNVNKAYALEHMNVVLPLAATAHLQS